MLEEKIKQLEQSSLSLADKKSIKQIKDLADLVIKEFEPALAYRLALFIQKNQKTTDNKNIELILNKLMAMSLSRWPEVAQLDFFENGIGVALQDDRILMADRVYDMLIAVPRLDRDEFKLKLINRLSINKEVVSKSKIYRNNEQLPATIENILKGYISDYEGSSKGLILAKYLTQGAVSKFSEKDKEMVKNLLEIFDLISTSTYDPTSAENIMAFTDIDGLSKMYDRGFVTVLSKPKVKTVILEEKEEKREIAPQPTETLNIPPEEISENTQPVVKQEDSEQLAILKAYQGDEKIQQAIDKEENSLTEKYSNKPEVIQQEFFTAVQRKNIPRTIACLKVLANTKNLESFISKDQKLNSFLKAVWQKRYGNEFIQNFEANPAQPIYLKLFLQYVLQERLEMTETDAARVAVQIGNIFANFGNQEFINMAFFDLPTRQFKWFE